LILQRLFGIDVTVDNGLVTLGRKILVWGLLVASGLALVTVGVFFGVARLDDADKWGSVIGALVALLGLPMTVYGVVLARRGLLSSAGQLDTGGGNASQAVRQRVRAGRDAYVAGRDQHFGNGGPRSQGRS
jgi:hypothetical protein